MRKSNIIFLDKNIVNNYYKELDNTLMDIYKGGENALKYFSKYLKKISSDAELLVRIRVFKTAVGSLVNSNSFDTTILNGINSIIEAMAGFLSGRLLSSINGEIVVKVEKEIMYKGRKFVPGDTILMELKQTIYFYAMGWVKPVSSLVDIFTRVEEK